MEQMKTLGQWIGKLLYLLFFLLATAVGIFLAYLLVMNLV